jgi:hypothetical protein
MTRLPEIYQSAGLTQCLLPLESVQRVCPSVQVYLAHTTGLVGFE